MSSPESSTNKSPERWGSRIGVILAVAGSAVGLGNFLRFPGQVSQNGGGAFMIPYFISLLVLGIPLCWAEWTMGRYGGLKGFRSAPGIFATICRNRSSAYFGVFALLVPLVIYTYYVVIEAWCLGYAISYLTGDLMLGAEAKNYGDFFGDYVGKDENMSLLKSEHSSFLMILIFTFSLNLFLIYRGVSKGIETFCKISLPIMIVCALCVLVRVMTLPAHENGNTVVDGLNYMWTPDFSELLEAETWMAAAGQIFFSLSVGFGVIINYASYLRREDDVVLSGLTSSSMNEFFEVCLGGLITLPAAFIFLGASVGEQGTFGLGFNALPNVFAQMPAGQFFGFLWFFMLFLAAVTSSISMLQPVIAFIEEGLGLKRHAAVTFLGLISLFGTVMVILFSEGLATLDTLDFWAGTFCIFVLAMIQAIIYGWIFGIDRAQLSSSEGAHFQIPLFVQYMLKFVTPVYLLLIFIGFCTQNLSSRLKSIYDDEGNLIVGNVLAIGFIVAIAIFFVVMINIALKRWGKQGKFAPELTDDQLIA